MAAADGTVGPLVTVSDRARELVLAYRGSSDKPNPERLAMWIEITGATGGTFTYDMYLKYADDAGPHDVVVSVNDDLQVVIPASSVGDIRGSTVDVADGPGGGGLFVQNPQAHASPAVGARSSGPAPELSGEVAARVTQLIDQQINPAIAAHGGFCELVAVEDATAYVRLSGGCQGCGMAAVTLSHGIEVQVRELVPEIQHVIDVTDHAAGSNPYYEPGKGDGGGK